MIKLYLIFKAKLMKFNDKYVKQEKSHLILKVSFLTLHGLSFSEIGEVKNKDWQWCHRKVWVVQSPEIPI